MKNINDICTRGKKVIIRVDFNVPLDKNFNVTDNSRLIAALPTINKVAKEGGKAILISHLGRPKNGFDDKLSLQHIVNSLSILLKNKDILKEQRRIEIIAKIGLALQYLHELGVALVDFDASGILMSNDDNIETSIPRISRL